MSFGEHAILREQVARIALEHIAAGNSWVEQMLVMEQEVMSEHSAVTDKVDAAGMVVVHMGHGVLMRTGIYGDSLFKQRINDC